MVDQPGRELVISRQAQKFILSLPAGVRARIREAVTRILAGDFVGLDIKRLEPHPHDFRLRIGKVRVLFTADSERLFIFRAGFRGGVYK